jgi:ADP-heptose:LPS heptosyltransferase
MVWDPEADQKPEVFKCRDRLIGYCTGIGLDVGCGYHKIVSKAIGVDHGGKADINCDISQGLSIFADNFFDYIFSSHCLEDMLFPQVALRDWWSKIKVGGHLILYLPHKDYYPNVGTVGCNVEHKNDFCPDDIIGMLKGWASYELVRDEVHNEDDEYSFELVFRKTATRALSVATPKHRDRRPRALVIRYGAYGDHIIGSVLPKALSQDGYHVTYNCTSRAFPVIANSPYIDEIMEQEDNLVPNTRLDEFWAELGKGYDKVINLSESVECRFLVPPDRPGHDDPVEVRRERYGYDNYYDYALSLGGYQADHPRPELYLTPYEQAVGQFFRRKYQDKFLILWALSGSGSHKAYPFAYDVAMEFLERHQDAMTFTVGDDYCRLLEWTHERAKKRSAQWDIRTSLLATQFVDLVIGPETGVFNASGCYATPKIGFLTHSNKTNLVKYYRNDYSMQADIECSPCHRMVYMESFQQHCALMDLGEGAYFSACAAAFPPEEVYRRMEFVYQAWKKKRRSIIIPGDPLFDSINLRKGIFNPTRSAIPIKAAASVR